MSASVESMSVAGFAGDRGKERRDAARLPDLGPKQHQVLRRRVAMGSAGVAALLLAAAAGNYWWENIHPFETTDDAFIDARIVALSPQVAGAISDLNVSDNQPVKAGDLIARLDDTIYRAQLAQATAQVEQSGAGVANLEAQLAAQRSRIDQAERQITEARAALVYAEQQYGRYQDLARTGIGTQQRAQQAASDLAQSQASVAAAQANEAAVEKQLPVLETQRAGAIAQLRAMLAGKALAEANLRYAEIRAPVDGRITQLSGAKGTYLQAGQSLAMFVPDTMWVTANFKETQLRSIRPGQAVSISIDAFPSHDLVGRVDSIQSGSGTAFSLLPAQNATGNYVKVVQRVPVKILFDQRPDVHIGPGMSVSPRVAVR